MSIEREDPELERMDATLLGILQYTGKIDEFLNLVFGFLYRRTDFYVIVPQGQRFGFPPGAAERIAATAYKRFEAIAAQKQGAKLREIHSQLNQDEAAQIAEEQAAQLRAYEEAAAAAAQHTERSAADADTKPKATPKATPQATPKASTSTASHHEDSASAGDSASHKAEPKPATQKPKKPVEPGKTQVNDVYNGADCDAYSWSQTIREADLRVKVPSTCRSAQMLKVEYKKKYLSVQIKEENGELRTLVGGPLVHELNTDECLWTFVPGEYVHFHLQKAPERWWDGIFEDKEKIDLDKIEAVRPVTDLNDEAKMTIDGLMEDDDRKKRGLPTREQEKMYEILRKGWNAPGSPFAGQPNPNDALKNRTRGPYPDLPPDMMHPMHHPPQ